MTLKKFPGSFILYRMFSGFAVAGILLLISSAPAYAQPEDSLIQINESVRVDTLIQPDSVVYNHSVRKAVIFSLICPGLGQFYNKKYWKIPFIYGAGGAFLYYVNYNHLKYKKFRDALYDFEDTKEDVVIDGYIYRYESLEQGRDYWRRNRDLSVAGTAAIYLLNVIDAMVDATFFYYDISDDLTLKLEPAVMQNTGYMDETASVGFRIRIGF